MYVDVGNPMYREPREANRGCLVSVRNKTLQAIQLVQRMHMCLMRFQTYEFHIVTIGVQNVGNKHSGVLTTGVRIVPC